MTDIILSRREGRVLTLALNRPDNLNAITAELLTTLAEKLTAADADPEVGVVVLTGTGRAFSAGGDMQSLKDPSTTALPVEEQARQARELCAATILLHEISKPTIAMLRGPVAGGGIALAAACDMRIASQTAKFTFAYPRIALGGDIGASYFLRRLLGAAGALEFCLLSPLIDAAEALRIGLVNRVVPDEELETATGAVTKVLAASSPLGLAAVKDNLRAAETLPMAAALDREAENLARCRVTEDHREAVLAFIEKRKPVFAGH